MNKQHILRSQQYDRVGLESLFTDVDKLVAKFKDPEGRGELRKSLSGKLMHAIFYEPSTRTRISFCSAAFHLGMRSIVTENARLFSSAVKGETLEDTIRVLAGYYPDVIVLRHHETGGADRAAKVVDDHDMPVSIINAGDGEGQHPTQALLDLYTIKSEIGRLDDITVTIGGDLKNGRTARSLVYLLSKFDNIRFVFISPEGLVMRDDILEHLGENNLSYNIATDMNQALAAADVVYWTRIQKERGSTNDDQVNLTIGLEQMRCMRSKSALLHPLPRVGEISKDVDGDNRAAFFRQSDNGMFVRMVLLQRLCA